MAPLYRELCVSPTTSQCFKACLDVRADNWDISRELTDGDQEVSEQDEDSVQLDQETSQGPAEEDEEDTECECSGALEFLATGEKGDGLLEADYQGQADEEEDLFMGPWRSVKTGTFS